MNIYRISDYTDVANNYKGVQEYTLSSLKGSLEMIANQSINLSEPDSILQAKDNLLGLARLILSTCARYDIKVT